MNITLIKAPQAIDSSAMDDLGVVTDPHGAPSSTMRRIQAFTSDDGVVRTGTWECTPGTWRRSVFDPEFSHFISGSATFVADSGQMVEISGGDAIYFPANSPGTWIVHETLRKTYLIFK